MFPFFYKKGKREEKRERVKEGEKKKRGRKGGREKGEKGGGGRDRKKVLLTFTASHARFPAPG